MSNRHPKWDARLHVWLSAARNKPYRDGRHDCMVGLVGGVALAVLGRDYAKGHRGKYRSAKGAALYLRRLGFDSPAAMLDTLFEERPVAKARRGDLVLSDAGVPGVCLGSKAAFIGMTDEREGLITLPRTSWVRAWSVGN